FNQSMVSRLYNGVDVPKTLTAVRNWISKESEKMKKTREF
ncbi:5463_t:CDS:1, partial [Rhizophagus irregularis]